MGVDRRVPTLVPYEDVQWYYHNPRKILSLMLLEHQDVITEFYSPSQWKELSKEMSSKILPCGEGSCWKSFKPIASLIEKEKLK
ncbi:hypothetical protein Tco_0818971 [Tanacetum coccineum]